MAIPSILPNDYVTAFLRNGSNSNNLAVDGSVTPVEFSWSVPADHRFYLVRILISLVDNVAMNADEFGGINALTNGIEFELRDGQDAQVLDFLDGETIKRNADFASFAGVDVAQLAGNRGVGVRWTFSKGTEGRAIQLAAGQKLVLTVNDDLTNLIAFTAAIQGMVQG